MSSFVPNKRHLRGLLIYFFNLKKSAAEPHRLIVGKYGESALNEKSCLEWFQKFKNGEFDIEDKERSGRAKVYKDAELEALFIRSRSVSNARRTFTYIRSDSKNNFTSFKTIGNDSKTRKFGSI